MVEVFGNMCVLFFFLGGYVYVMIYVDFGIEIWEDLCGKCVFVGLLVGLFFG